MPETVVLTINSFTVSSTSLRKHRSRYFWPAHCSCVQSSLMVYDTADFENETTRRITNGFKVSHHLTTIFTPWISGALERLCKERHQLFRSKGLKLCKRAEEQVYILPLVQNVVYNAASPQRGDIPPITIFTRIEASASVSRNIRSSTLAKTTVKDVQRKKRWTCS